MQRLRAIIATSLVIALVFPTAALGSSPSRIYDITFADPSSGYMAGVWTDSSGKPKGFVSSSTNGGLTWGANQFTTRALVGVDALSAASAWSVGYQQNFAWKTGNAGVSWIQSAGTFGSPNTERWDIAHIAANTALTAGWDRDAVYGQLATIWRTTDGGASWSKVHDWFRYPAGSDGSIPQTVAQYNAVDGAPSGTLAYAVGFENQPATPNLFKQALLARTSNSGASWANITLPTGTPALNDVIAVDGTVAWTVGVTGTTSRVLKSENSGSTWAFTAKNPPIPTAQGIHALDKDNAVVVGDGGWVARTRDGGANWTTWRASTANRVLLSSVVMLDANRAIAVGDDQLFVRLTLNPDGSMTGKEFRTVEGSYGDGVAPTTTLSGVPAVWTKNDVTFSLSAVDNAGGTGVKGTFYRLGAGSNTAYSAPVAVSAEGVTSLAYWSVDEVDNKETDKTAQIKIDKTAPITTSNALTEYEGSATITLTPSDALSGVTATKYRVNGGVWKTGTVFATSTTGSYTLDFYSEDNAANIETTKQASFTVAGGTVDTTAPVTEVSVIPSGWTASDVTFTLSSEDNVGGSGVKEIWYQLGSDAPKLYTDTVMVTRQGETTLKYWAVDNAVPANPETPKTATIKIDKTAPVTLDSGVPTGWTNKSVGVILNRSDVHTSVTSTYYTLTGATTRGQTLYTGSAVSIVNPGTTTMEYWSVDLVGNVEARKTATIKIDKTSPKATLGTPSYAAGSTKITIQGTDTGGAGVKEIQYRVNGGAIQKVTGASAPVSLTKLGTNRLEYRAVDHAGNAPSLFASANLTVKAPTTLSLSAPSAPAYASARLAGRLTDSAGKTIYNKPIVLEYSYDKVNWTRLTTVYTTKKDSKGWFYEYIAKPTKKVYYRARFAGDAVNYEKTSALKTVLPKVSLTRPSFGRTTLAFGKTYKATGYLKPRHKAYTYPVKIAAYRYENGKYRWKKSYAAKAYNYSSYTKYVRSIKLPSKGTWRLRVVHAADSLNAKTYSSYRYVTVK